MSAEVEAETQQEDVQQEYSGSGSKDWPPSVGGDGGGEELSGGEDSSDTSSGSTSEEGEEEEEETDSSKGSKDKSAEDILRETLLALIPDSDALKALVNHKPASHAELHPSTIFKELVSKMNYLWFDLFAALGVSHRTLDNIRRLHPTDPNVSLFFAIREWLKGGSGDPSWAALVRTLRQDMLEAKLADGIAQRHFTAQELDRYKKETRSVINDPLPAGLEDDDTAFSKLLVEISDQLGPDSFCELSHLLKTLYCPDGSHFIDHTHLRDQRSPEGLFLPLLYNNLLVSHDLDLLIAILRGLGRDDLMHLLQEYSLKLVVGFPIFKPIQDAERCFSLLVELQPRATELDLEGVCYIKQAMCEMLGVTTAPYLLQFLGWRKGPIVVQFQAHMCLVDRAREALSRPAASFASGNLENFTRLEMNVKGSLFTFIIGHR